MEPPSNVMNLICLYAVRPSAPHAICCSPHSACTCGTETVYHARRPAAPCWGLPTNSTCAISPLTWHPQAPTLVSCMAVLLRYQDFSCSCLTLLPHD